MAKVQDKKAATLLQWGADVNARDSRSGETPLLVAITYGGESIGPVLRRRDLDLRRSNKQGNTALDYAVHSLVPDTVRLILAEEERRQQTPSDTNALLLRTALRGDVGEVESLMASGADVNCSRPLGLTPLFGETVMYITASIALLCRRGAKVDSLYCRGGTMETTALMVAVRFEDVATARVLLDAGANINYRNTRGDTILLLAVSSQSLSLLHLLTDAKYIGRIDREELASAVAEAARSGNAEAERLLKAAYRRR